MNVFKRLLLIIPSILILSCTHVSDDIIDVITQETATSILKSQIEKLILDKAPLLPSPANPFSIVNNLEFKPKLQTQPEITYNDKGEMLLEPGDYTIPVMSFCLQYNNSSPSGYVYILNQLQGRSAKMIRQINQRAFPKYEVSEIQSLIWNILGGLSYSEMDSTSQKIITDIIPEYKKDLEKSYYRELQEKWNKVADKSQGIIPDFESATNDYLKDLGEVGTTITKARDLHDKIIEANGSYDSLRGAISTRKVEQKEKITPWSKISERVYARFVTDGSFNDVGNLQVRVLPQVRQTSSITKDLVTLDIYSLFADSNNTNVQPLLLTPLYGFAGVAIRQASLNPYAATAVMAALLAAKTIEWDRFFDLVKQTRSPNQSTKDTLRRGENLLNEIYDRLDKPLKDTKIISDKNLDKDKKDDITRQYKKKGNEKNLKDDFDKLPGEKSIAKDGTEIKTLPNGDKIVSRRDKTLEVQPPNGKERVKVRYIP